MYSSLSSLILRTMNLAECQLLFEAFVLILMIMMNWWLQFSFVIGRNDLKFCLWLIFAVKALSFPCFRHQKLVKFLKLMCFEAFIMMLRKSLLLMVFWTPKWCTSFLFWSFFFVRFDVNFCWRICYVRACANWIEMWFIFTNLLKFESFICNCVSNTKGRGTFFCKIVMLGLFHWIELWFTLTDLFKFELVFWNYENWSCGIVWKPEGPARSEKRRNICFLL